MMIYKSVRSECKMLKSSAKKKIREIELVFLYFLKKTREIKK